MNWGAEGAYHDCTGGAIVWCWGDGEHKASEAKANRYSSIDNDGIHRRGGANDNHKVGRVKLILNIRYEEAG